MNGWVVNDWVGSKEQKGIFGAYSMPHQGILLEYYHATWICILWCGKLFPDEAHNILPRWQAFMRENNYTIIWIIVFIYPNGACDLQH